MNSMVSLPSDIHFFERGWLSSNNILLTDDQQSVLIDTGYWTHAEQTQSLLQQAIGDKPLTRIVNTHLHSDHCGGNALLQANHPQVQTWVPPGHANHVFDWDPAALTYAPTGQHCPKFDANDVIAPGDVFSVASREWQALAAPGHDPNSIIFFCASESLLISADALWENGFGVVFPELEGIHAFQEVADTLDLIESLQVSTILPGHGKPFTDVEAALARARSKLAMYQADPEKHALYAAKVLLKFKLLEFQQIDFHAFTAWAQSSSYLIELHQQYAKHMSFSNWMVTLCDSLIKSGAAERDGSLLSNL
jgi:glyoxylase-like metal-dependent hydrolase (beta-lactamase superfamily II)